MQTINVSSLKANLSSTLKKASRGQKILVVDRKMPLAQITPVDEKVVFVQIPSGKIPTKPRHKVMLEDDVVADLIRERRR